MLLFLSVILSVVLSAGGDGDHKPEDLIPGITEVTPENVDSILDGTKPVFMEFYAPWCGHCKALAPEMAKLGEAITKHKGAHKTVVAKVDCDAHGSICSKYGARGYPTLKFFKTGSSIGEKFEGERTLDGIVDFLKDNSDLRIVIPKELVFSPELGSHNFDEIVMNSENDVLVKFYAPWCGHCKKLAPEYEWAAKALDRESNCLLVSVDATKTKDLAERYDVTGYPTLKFFSKDNKEPEDYSGARDAEGLLKYMNEKCGTVRDLNGKLDNTAGIIDEMAIYAVKFRTVSSKIQAKLAQRAVGIAESVEETDRKKYANYYVKVMDNIQKKGNDYVENEIERLVGLMESEDLNPAIADYMQIRMNILGKF